MSRLRIFVTTSALNTFFLSIHAKATQQSGDVDVFLIDKIRIKDIDKSYIVQIASAIHKFTIMDFSNPLENEATTNPGLFKKLTRYFKAKPILKQFYKFLYTFRVASDNRKLKAELSLKFQGILNRSYNEVILHTLPKAQLNAPLEDLFAINSKHYFEHGIGDYEDIQEQDGQPNFHCLFHEGFKSYLKQQNPKKEINIFPVASEIELSKLQTEISNLEFMKNDVLHISGNVALIIAQPLEDLSVSPAFWDAFLDKCVSTVEFPLDTTFLIKSHSRQNNQSISRLKHYFLNKKLNVEILEDPALNNIPIEFLFPKLGKVTHIFSPYSSGLFYLSFLYSNEGCKYYFSISRFKGYDKFVSEIYKKRWLHFRSMINFFVGDKVLEL